MTLIWKQVASNSFRVNLTTRDYLRTYLRRSKRTTKTCSHIKNYGTCRLENDSKLHGPERLRICETIYRRCTWRFTAFTCSDRAPETGRFVCFRKNDFYPVTGFSKADRVPIPCVVFAILISPPPSRFCLYVYASRRTAKPYRIKQ